MHLLCTLSFFIEFFNIDLTFEHIAGVKNCAADILSRNISFYSDHRYLAIPLQLFLLLTPQGMDWALNIVQSYYRQGAVQYTKCVYLSGQQRYLNFCSSVPRQPLLTCKSTLLLFLSHMAICRLSYTTIKVSLFAVRHLLPK